MHSGDLLPAAVNAYLIHFCLSDIAESIANAITRKWSLTDDEFDSLAIKAYPSEITNLIASHACFEMFGERIAHVPGFYFSNVWRLDLNPRWSNNGYLMPQRDSRGFIVRLRAFRNPHDEHGFAVKVRKAAA